MKIADKLCKTMNKINEDVIYYNKDCAFIIDGHSSDNSKMVKKYVKVLKRNLKKNIYSKDLLKALNISIKETVKVMKKYTTKMPSASIVIIRENKDKIEVLVVGNPKCLIEAKKIEVVEDKRMELYEDNLLNKIQRLHKTEKISILEANKRVKEALIKNRTNPVYPVISSKPLSKEDIAYKEFNYEDVISAIIFSDGFYAYKDYLMIKNNNLYDIVKNNGLMYGYNHIRRMEMSDTNLSNFPRLKLYDDASAIYVKFYQ